LILKIQNDEYNIDLSINEQSDLLNIENEYISKGGNFWVCIDREDKVIGTIALLNISDDVAVLKKFFVDSRFRGSNYGIGANLFDTLLSFVKKSGIKQIILDTPAVAVRSHNFYKKVGFKLINKESLPVEYSYPDRNSFIFLLDIK
jgi:N-acetylglutamate synthase-like GNAT family acetyltransferase